MRSFRLALLCVFASALSIATTRAQTNNEVESQGRHISPVQIKVLTKALANAPKGIIYIESVGWLPQVQDPPPAPLRTLPAPPLLKPVAEQLAQPVETHSDFDEAKELSDQLMEVLKSYGYTVSPSIEMHGYYPKGISIRIFHHKDKAIGEAMRDSLVASHINGVRLNVNSQDTSPFLTDALMKITIGFQQADLPR